MLFNSYAFVLAFLPVPLAGFYALSAAASGRAGIAWLTAASLFFYGWWNPAHLWVPLASAAVNFALARCIAGNPGGVERHRKALLGAGIVANVAFLAYFKAVASPWFGAAPDATGAFSVAQSIAIPLGVSFVTFRQITFLVDVYQQRIGLPRLSEYAFFLVFFPQLVMGPIVHYRQIAPQLARPGFGRIDMNDLACGLAIFVVGLAKKVLLADSIGPYADQVFQAAGEGHHVTLIDAWGGAIAFQFQIYFDFSGYADMAIGAARMFGVNLPVNFDAPHRATDRFDFWRRWHITFASFMRQYVFVPLTRNKWLPLSAPISLLLTVLLSGLWHGLAWTFVAWGLAQGAVMLGLHALRSLSRKSSFGPDPAARLPLPVRIGATFLTTCFLGVLFRSSDLGAVVTMFNGMLGAHGIVFPARIGRAWEAVVLPVVGALGLSVPQLNAGDQYLGERDALVLAVMAVVIWIFPATQRLFARVWTGLEARPPRDVPRVREGTLERRLKFALDWRWAGFVAALLILTLLALPGRGARFIYYQF